MMNIGELLTSIKMDLGIYGIALPFPDENKVLYDTIKLKTIKTFSQYSPHVMSIKFNLNDMKCVQSTYEESIYEIPDIFGDRRIMGVRNVNQTSKLMGSGYLSPMYDESMDMYQSLMMAQANANLISSMTPAFTFKFRGPNLLHLYNVSNLASDLMIDIALEHLDNLSSIPNTAWESFYSLAILDIKKVAYGSLKHYSEIQTAYGTVNLKIDDWAGADDERKNLLEKWNAVYHLDAEQIYII